MALRNDLDPPGVGRGRALSRFRIQTRHRSPRAFSLPEAQMKRASPGCGSLKSTPSWPSLLAVLLLLGPVSAQAQMATGSYVGNGTAGRAITGLGFQPDIVIIKVDYADAIDDLSAGVIRTSTMIGDISKPIKGAQAPASNLIQSLDADGYTVGNEERVNWAVGNCGGGPCSYYWVAFQANPNVRVGTYTGNGGTQSITGLGFSPEYVAVMARNNGRAMQRSNQGVDSHQFQAGSPLTTQITSLDANGFTVTHDGSSPFSNVSGVVYDYVAWNAVAGLVKVGSYVGDGVDDRNITGVGFQPEYVIVKVMNENGDPMQRSSAMSGDASMNFRDALNPNRIQALQADGFQVGTHANVNLGPGACPGPSDCNYFYVAFAATQTNYRSIGTAADYNTGMVTVTPGSASVSGTGGTTWKASNRGGVDVIIIPCAVPPACAGGTPYTVAWVGSDTTLQLTQLYSGAGGSQTYLIRRQYSTLGAWEDCVDGGPCSFFGAGLTPSLVADDRREVGIAYKDSVFTLAADVIIDGSTTDATHTIRLTADGLNRHYGTAGMGVIVDAGGAPNELLVEDANLTVEGLAVPGGREPGGVFSPSAIRVLDTGTTNILLQNLLIHDYYEPAGVSNLQGMRLSGTAGKTVTIRNTMIWDGDARGIQGDEAGDSLTIENCSIDDMRDTLASRQGVWTDATPGVLVSNTIATRSGTDFQGGGNFSASSTNNTASDGTAPGANPQMAAAASLFVTPGSDLHLKAGAVALDSGVGLAPRFFNDIDGGFFPPPPPLHLPP